MMLLAAHHSVTMVRQLLSLIHFLNHADVQAQLLWRLAQYATLTEKTNISTNCLQNSLELEAKEKW